MLPAPMAGAHPADRATFPDSALAPLRTAVEELSWLLGRGYADDAALTIVGNHHQLDVRQRMAVRRCACSDAVASRRRACRRQTFDGLIAIDGFNQLVTIERALAGGALLRGRDSALRDIASVHGTWRRGDHTHQAIALISALFPEPAQDIIWVLDSPVSNSGRLAELIREERPHWRVEVVATADNRLAQLGAEGAAVGTSDGGLIDRCAAWVPVAERALLSRSPLPWIIDLSGE